MEVEFKVFRRLSVTVVGVATALLFFASSSTAGPGSEGTDCEVGFARPVGASLEFHKFFLDVAGDGGADEFNKQFGRTTDGILVGDWDGNVSDNFAKTRQVGSTLKFLLDFGDGGQEEVGFSFGQFATDTPVGGGDWDGPGVNGTTQHVGFVRDNGSGNWRWFLDTNNDGSVAEIRNVVFGLTTDMPIVGDWDGDGTDTVAVFRLDDGNWYLKLNNATGVADHGVHFHAHGDDTLPVAGAFDTASG